MNRKALVVKASDRAPLNVVGTKVIVLASDTDTRDRQVTLQSGTEGSGPPPHSHNWDESFYVTRGLVQFVCDGQTTLCSAGTLVHIPAGTVHAFSYGPQGGEMLEITGAGSNAIRMFTALDRQVPPGPPDIPTLVQVAGEHGVKFHA